MTLNRPLPPKEESRGGGSKNLLCNTDEARARKVTVRAFWDLSTLGGFPIVMGRSPEETAYEAILPAMGTWGASKGLPG